MVALCKQCYRTSKCLTTMGPTLCTNLCYGFVSLYVEIYLMHWVHRIEDTNTLDVDEYYHLFNSPIVRTQLQKYLDKKDISEDI